MIQNKKSGGGTVGTRVISGGLGAPGSLPCSAPGGSVGTQPGTWGKAEVTTSCCCRDCERQSARSSHSHPQVGTWGTWPYWPPPPTCTSPLWLHHWPQISYGTTNKSLRPRSSKVFTSKHPTTLCISQPFCPQFNTKMIAFLYLTRALGG